MASIGMVNSEGVVVDLYIPRKCSVTNNLIGPKDHASVQLQVAQLDEDGKYIQGRYETYAFCGDVRSKGGVDAAFTSLAQKKGLIRGF